MDNNTHQKEDHMIMLIEEWKNNNHNNDILDKIIQQNKKMIYKIANYYQNVNFKSEDLFIEGVMGLITSLNEFKPEFNVKFSTYAYYWIKSFIHKYIVKTTILVPNTSNIQLENMDNIELDSEYNIKSYQNALNIAISLLKPIERQVIKDRWYNKLTLNQIAENLHMSVEGIRKVESRSIDKIKQNIEIFYGEIGGFIIFDTFNIILKNIYIIVNYLSNMLFNYQFTNIKYI